MKKIITLLVVLSIQLNSIAQQTYVPDDNFEQALIDLGYDSGALDNYVPTSNIANVYSLNVSYKNISDLTGIEDFTNLEILDCKSNNLTSLNVTSNTLLGKLYCYRNNLSSLDVSTNTVLRYLYCYNNNLTELNLDANIVLERFYCHRNNLTELDLSMIPTLRYFICYYNELTALNIKSGNNTNISFFSTIGNANLSCVEVDDANYSTTNWASIDATTSFSEDCHFNETYVPDNNFEQALIDLGYDSGALDDYVSTPNIANLVNLDISNKNISDLTGIEDFTNLEILNCRRNDLTNLDVSENIILKELNCSINDINTLNVSSNILLDNLNCSNNNLNEIDIVSNTLLRYFSCGNNNISDLNVSINVLLEYLYCSTNSLSTLNLTNNILLENLYCSRNNLTELDVSMIPNLRFVLCNFNDLTEVNMKNGNNTNIFFFWSFGNYDLSCVEVDDANYSTTNWTSIDATTSFSENCRFDETYVPDDNFEQALINLGYDSGALDNYVPTANIENVTFLSISNKNISDLTGIEDFTNLSSLYCHRNNLTTLDLSENSNLIALNCSINNLTALNLNQNSPFTYINCQYNQIDVLDVTSFTQLYTLFCGSNQLTSLDLRYNTNLVYFNSNSNQLTYLNLKNGYNTNIVTSIGIANNPNLFCVQVDDANYSTINWTYKDSQTFYSESPCQHSSENTTWNTTSNETKIAKIGNKQLVSEKLIIANTNESTIYIKTKNNSKISELKIFDTLGKLVFEASPNKSELFIPTTINKGSILFVKAQLENGTILNAKFIKH